ncbi:hypothetical protein J5X98_05205 [Leptothermofonsia sichuanensis E412]|jgi:hypothetical protein|uniref:hypothetical protein n=1 Tax=Leptothermofonsia sichuanensis TaxID=2917832 RepID=UPI001CA70A25|nr:hypothetical protein [Leptothermofonsia sichuanensis]QZZ21836.1 hypothetical protein J5X98_05205 [Leptothermofonsia sichuanensis E412]
MMDQRQQELRHAAARAFMESLDQLQDTLQTPHNQAAQLTPHQREAKPSASVQFDLNTFEQAVADIEEFIERRHQKGA